MTVFAYLNVTIAFFRVVYLNMFDFAYWLMHQMIAFQPTFLVDYLLDKFLPGCLHVLNLPEFFNRKRV